MQDITVGLNNGRFVFQTEFVDDIKKLAEMLAEDGSEVVVVFAPEDEDLTLCNSAKKEKIMEATPDELLEWIFGFREL